MRKWIITVLLLFGLVAGCTRVRRTIGRTQAPTTGQLSKVELRDELDRFEAIFITSIKETAAEIDAAAKTRRVERTNMQMKMRIIEAMHAMMSSDDSVVAFFDTWGLVIRLRYYLERGHGSKLYGEEQSLAIDFIKEAEQEINRIGQLFLMPDQFEKIQRNLKVFASQHPITGTYANLVVYATQEEKEAANALMKTLRIPMAPIRAMEGVDKTGDAILRVRDSVDRFTDVTEQIPESVRWQLSILMDDLEDSEMSRDFLSSLNEFSQSSARLVEVMESMPVQLRTELLTVLKESDQTQQQFQITMQTASEAAVQLEKTLAEFQKATERADQTTAQAAEAAQAWKEASDSIQELVKLFKYTTPRPPDAPSPFGMRDFDDMLTNAGHTADKVSEATARIQQTMDAGASLDLQKELQSLIDHIAIRLFELILAVLILIVGYRYVIKKKRT